LANGNGLITASSRLRLRFAADERLVAFVRRGDPAAFETLYERHARELLSFCTYLLGSRQDAEDAVQSTFAAAYRALLGRERPVALRPWLFTIARNACLSILRKRRPTAELNGEPALNGDPFRELELREEVRLTVQGMLELPERQRAALVLAEMHGLSQAEIGAVLGVRAEQVKAYIYQARSQLVSARRARDADCVEIREELSSAHGAALLRRRLRGHVRACAGCRAYADGINRQRRHLGALLPWAPSLLLKTRALEHALAMRAPDPAYAGGTAVGGSLAGAAAELAGGSVKGLVAKVAAGVACLGTSACVGAAVLGSSIFPGQAPTSAGQGAQGAQPRVAASTAASGSLTAASLSAGRRARSGLRGGRSRGASAGADAIGGPPRGGGALRGASGATATELPPGDGLGAEARGRCCSGEQHAQKLEARQRAGGEGRQHKLEGRQHKLEERAAARPPKPSKEERLHEREARHEEVGASGGPKKTKEERHHEREQRRKERGL
jgi:RNA polymerase sigma factor (sigma-70 family)